MSKEEFRSHLVNLDQGGFEDSIACIIMQSINVCLSIIACVSTLWIIFRSEIGLSSTYHRLMAVFSILGIIVATFGGLSYLLYPRDDRLLGWPFFVNDRLVRLGSTLSCDMQGMVLSGGYFIHQGYLSSLLVYYFFEIVLQLKSEVAIKCIESLLHIVPIIGGTIVIVWGLQTQSFNPHPSVSWCAFIRYPPLCPEHCWEPDDSGCECIRGNPEDDYNFNKRFVLAVIYFYSLVDFVAMFSITIKFMLYNADLKEKLKELDTDGLNLEEESDELKEIHFKKSTTRDALFQTTLYVLVLVALFVSTVMTQYFEGGPSYDIANAFRIFFVSLQGFLYFLIFLYIKVHNLQFIQPDLSKWDAVKETFFASPDDRLVLVGLSDISIEGRNREMISDAMKFECFHDDLVDNDRDSIRNDVNDIQSTGTPSGATICPAITNHLKIYLDEKNGVVNNQEDISEVSNHSQSLGSMVPSNFDYHSEEE